MQFDSLSFGDLLEFERGLMLTWEAPKFGEKVVEPQA